LDLLHRERKTMSRKGAAYYLAHITEDLPAGIVVFLVALPLCLGIALASGAPLFSGLIAGFVGGLVVAWASGSQLSVSGPAAGLTVIIYTAVEHLGGNFRAFLVAVVICGVLQIVLGVGKAGVLSAYFPTSVIKGMLAAIGLILITKQLPHAIGFDRDFEGDEAFAQADAETTFSELVTALSAISPGAVIVSVVAMAILLVWDSRFIQRTRALRLLPGPLLAVSWGAAYQLLSTSHFPALSIATEHLVQLPETHSLAEFLSQFSSPDWSQLSNPTVYVIALTLAAVASLETLLSLEAADKLDPLRRVAPTNRELKAQGLGNIISGLLGGLPMTAVIVRTSANINAGAHTKVSCFFHGILLLMAVVFFARYLNMIPLASLAAILIMTGYKLAKPGLFLEMYRNGYSQIVPFVITILAILFTDLLKGITIGLACGLYFVIRTNFQAAVSLTKDGRNALIHLNKDVSFLNKPLLRSYLDAIEANSNVIIDGSAGGFIDHDIREMLQDFAKSAAEDRIAVTFRNIPGLNGQEPLTRLGNGLMTPQKV
jgi:MFS superfamily sulfate permease-like transporter